MQGQHGNVQWWNRLWKMLAAHMYTYKFTHLHSFTSTHTHRQTPLQDSYDVVDMGTFLSVKSICTVEWYVLFVWKTLCAATVERNGEWEKAGCRWSIETVADKRNVALFTMQSGIFIGFCEVRFCLNIVWNSQPRHGLNEKNSNDDYRLLCNTILFARTLRLSRHPINLCFWVCMWICNPYCGQRPPKGWLLQLSN